jgi:drug/metabolite transporter (DMT)-like permease
LRIIEHSITKSTGMGLTAALIAAALFGSVSTIAKPVLATVDPFLLSSLVYLISAMLFSAMIAVRNYTAAASSQLTTESSFSKRRYYLIVLITSIIGATIAPAIFFFGLRQTTASDTALLANGETIFSIMLAILFFKEKLRMFGYLAALMVLAGLVVVTTNLQFHGSLLKMNSGNLFILGALASVEVTDLKIKNRQG